MHHRPRAGPGGAPPGSAGRRARRRLLDAASEAIKARTGTAPDGDLTIRDAPSRANAPAVPSHLQAYPALSPPFFDKAGGADHKFAMWLTYPTDLEAIAAGFVNHFHWEVIRVPGDKLAADLFGVPLHGNGDALKKRARARAYAEMSERRVSAERSRKKTRLAGQWGAV